MALAELGSDLISSLSDQTKNATLASAAWVPVVKAVLRAYPWNCAKARKTLAPEGTTPTGDTWTYQFVLPPTCLRVLSVDTPDDAWTVEGRRVLTNTDNIHIEYIDYIEDVSKWDDLLAAAVSARLGHMLAYALTQSQSMKDNMWESYKMKVREARSVDAQENGRSEVQADEWLLERAI